MVSSTSSRLGHCHAARVSAMERREASRHSRATHLLVSSDSQRFKPKRGDLSIVKGLRIGAAPGVNLSLHRMLVEAGIDPEKNNVQIMPIPGAAGPNVSFGLSAAKALEDGKLDGFWANAWVAKSQCAGVSAPWFSMCAAATVQPLRATTLSQPWWQLKSASTTTRSRLSPQSAR